MSFRLGKFALTAVLALLLFTPLSISFPARAQQPSAIPQSRGPQLALILRKAEVEAQGPGREPASASSEDKGKKAPMDENAGEPDSLRSSPAVLWLARKTGMTPNQAYWVAVGVNFAAVFLFIVYMLRKKLPGYFSTRTAAIQKGIEEARKMSEEARARLTEVEGRLSRLGADIAAMRNEADENAKAEEKRIQQASEEERQRIVSSAQQEIDMAANAARRDLKAYAGELAINLAEKKIRVNQQTDENLVREFTTRLGKDGQ